MTPKYLWRNAVSAAAKAGFLDGEYSMRLVSPHGGNIANCIYTQLSDNKTSINCGDSINKMDQS